MPRVIVTDKLRRDGIARRQLHPRVEYRYSRYLNNRAESADTTTGTAPAAVQMVRASPELPLRSLLHLRSLPSPPTSTYSRHLSRDSGGQFRDLPKSNMLPTHSMISPTRLSSVPCFPYEVNGTMPLRVNPRDSQSSAPSAAALARSTGIRYGHLPENVGLATSCCLVSVSRASAASDHSCTAATGITVLMACL